MNVPPATEDLTCPDCQATVRAGTWFCPTCGADVLDQASASDSPATVLTASAESAGNEAVNSDRVPGGDCNTVAPASGRDAGHAPRALVAHVIHRIGRRRLIVASGVIALLLLGFVFIRQVRAASAPESLVKDFFAALAARDGEGARNLGGCARSPVCAAGGLDEGYEPPMDLRIQKVEYGRPDRNDTTRRPNKNRAAVQISYLVDGTTYRDVVYLVRNRAAGDFGSGSSGWSFANPVGEHINIKSPLPIKARIAGSYAEISALGSSNAASRNVWLPPGSYYISGFSDVLFDRTARGLAIGGRDACLPIPNSSAEILLSTPLKDVDGVNILRVCVSPEITMQLKPRPGAIEEINRQVREYLGECASQPVVRPRAFIRGIEYACPFLESDYDRRYGTMRHLKWTITKLPRFIIETPSEGLVNVRTARPGTARLTFDWSIGLIAFKDGWKRITENFPVLIGGQASFGGVGQQGITDPVGSSDPGNILWTPR